MNTAVTKIVSFCLILVLAAAPAGCTDTARTGNFTGEGGALWGDPAPSSSPSASSAISADPLSENWTVLIYMNGSDLESLGGEATANLASMLSVDLPDSVNVLIYTGGTKRWNNDVISADANQIWLAEDEGLTLLETLDKKSIGESGTLAEFLKYGQAYYPADKKALIFWNHGGGSIWGFGADEHFSYDGLTLAEMADAMAASGDGQPYELVGFDACLMASAETAGVMAPYARYMVASEEAEPGGGWDYAAFFGALAQRPSMDGLAWGIAITDSFYAKYRDTSKEGLITCSVLDLSYMPALETALDAYAERLTGAIVRPETMSAVSAARQLTEKYGEAPGGVSFDMVDLYDFVDQQEDAGQAYSGELMAAIENVVAYEVSGSQRVSSYGLSIYFPFAAKEYFDDSLALYRELDFCPGYQGFITEFAEQLTNEAVIGEVPDYQDTLHYVQQSDYGEVGSYYVQLTNEQMEYMCYVYCTLGWYAGDGRLLDMGYDSDLVINYDDNTIHDDFSYDWTGLNGQPAAVYVMDETDDYIVYDIPVLYNGEKAVVKGAWIWDTTHENNGYYMFTGVFYSSDEYTAPSSKLSIELAPGDVVTPIYWPYDVQDYDDYYVGEDIVIGSDGLRLEWVTLPGGFSYQYSFVFIDVYGNLHYSEPMDFEY